MKSLISAFALVLLAATGKATTVTVNASATGTTTTTVKTPGSILVNNTTNRGYAVFDLSSARIPDAATITSVKLIFTSSVSGSGIPVCNIYGYAGDISSLTASALYSGAVTSDNLYNASWGTSSGSITMSSTATADSFIQHNHTGSISTTWVESSSSRVYNITGGSSPQIQITYTCNNPSPITGATNVCSASTTTLTDTTVGGTWSSSNTSLATVNASGIVTGLAQGAVSISYTKGGCSVFQLMNVKSAPAAIAGVTNICLGFTATLANTSILGSWTSSNPSIASVDVATGVVRANSAGTATITYSTGCGANVTKTENVITTPAAISGMSAICSLASTTLSSTTTDGAWSSSNTSIATVNALGVVYGVSQGNVTITYGMGTCRTTSALLVKAAPSVISGAAAICNGSSILLTNTSLGGTWSSSNPAVATINTSGFVNSVGPGSSVITYSNGCGTAATRTETVELLPTAIVGATSTCTGYTSTVTEAVAGGTWSSSNTSVASVSSAGIITGITGGYATISYTLANSCGTNSVIHPMSVAQIGQWTGLSSTSWTDAGNWACATIPDVNVNVYIPAGTPFLPDFSSAHFDVRDLTLYSGVTITVNSGASINVHGDFNNNGIVNGDGSIKMNGASAQVMSGIGTVSNLTILNGAGVSINAADTVSIVTDLTINAGTFTTNSGLKLLSNSLGTGRIAPITGGGISGNVRIQQYFEGGRRAFRFVGHPFTHAIPLSMIGAGIDVTGPGGVSNGFTTTGTNAPSVFRYDPLTGNSVLGYDPGWKPFTSANSSTDTNAFNQYQGIRLFVRGIKNEGLGYGSYTPTPATITMTGTVNTGTQVITLRKGVNSDYCCPGNSLNV